MIRKSLSDTDYVLLDRFFAGETSATENEAAHALLACWPDVSERVQAIVNGIHALAPNAPDAHRSWEALMAVIPAYRSTAETMQHSTTVVTQNIPAARRKAGIFHQQTMRRSVWYGAVGVVMAALLLFVGLVGDVQHFWRHVPAAVARYSTANGQRGTVTLTDGSTVILNVGSRLEVPADYAAGDRTVRLVGEALITVSHQAGNQFTVMTGPIATRVLGTSFVVRRYGMDTVTTVAVRDGKVAVDRMVVTAGRMVEVGPSGVAHTGLADASQFDFAAGVLVLRSMTLSQAIPELDRWYDADVRLGDAVLAAKPIKGQVTAGSLADLTERLAVLFDVRVVRDGRVLTLYRK